MSLPVGVLPLPMRFNRPFQSRRQGSENHDARDGRYAAKASRIPPVAGAAPHHFRRRGDRCGALDQPTVCGSFANAKINLDSANKGDYFPVTF
jgi:hypothetical protein